MSLLVAVAGHVDHGKTALVRALTGIETDRLPEERRRGISIEAGLAHWHRPGLEDEPRVSLVDVPGHERYIRNMVAGIQGARAALLVIACTEGVMPQTREHAQILKLLGIRHWLAVLSQCDRMDGDQLARSASLVRQWLSEQAIDAELIEVSAHTGSGIPALAQRLTALAHTVGAAPEALRGGLEGSAHAARLCVDRSFIAAGEGLVVTGMLISGVLRSGDPVRISPSGRSARVRGLQVAGQAVNEVRAGTRCAVNLTGTEIDRHAVSRGDWIVAAELHHPVAVVDVRVGWLDGHAPPPSSEIQVHAGTARIPARLTPYRHGSDDGSSTQLARLRLARPTSAVVGDRWIMRSIEGTQTLGMAEVIWPFVDAGGLRGAAHGALLQTLDDGTPELWLRAALAGLPMAMAPERFAAAWALTGDEAAARARAAGAATCRIDGSARLVDDSRLERVRTTLLARVDDWHVREPESVGVIWAQLIGTLERRDTRLYAGVALSQLQAQGKLTRHGDRVFRPHHRPAPTAEDDRFRARVLPILTEPRSRSIHELSELLAMPVSDIRRALDRLALQGHAVGITPQRYLAVSQVESLAAAAVTIAQSGSLRAGDFSRATGIGRNLGIDVLEFFDRIRLTRRVGERRIVIDPQAMQRVLPPPSQRGAALIAPTPGSWAQESDADGAAPG